MSNMSAADILKIHGKWTESSKFNELISRKLKVSERQAYRIIKKDKQILKIVLSDRTVLYGLAEFGPVKFHDETPSTKEKSEEHYPFLQKLYEKIIELRLNPQPKINADGQIIYQCDIYTLDSAVRMLAEMEPKLKRTVEEAYEKSIMNVKGPVTWIGQMQDAEIDTLIGQLGQVLATLQAKQ